MYNFIPILQSFASLEPSSGEEPGAGIVILLPALLIILVQCFMV